jgi:hypothetical protein
MTYITHIIDNKYNNVSCIISQKPIESVPLKPNQKVANLQFESDWHAEKYFWKMIGDIDFANQIGKATTLIWNNTKLTNN